MHTTLGYYLVDTILLKHDAEILNILVTDNINM